MLFSAQARGKKHQQRFLATEQVAVADAVLAATMDGPVSALNRTALDMDAVQGKICSIDNPDCEACSA